MKAMPRPFSYISLTSPASPLNRELLPVSCHPPDGGHPWPGGQRLHPHELHQACAPGSIEVMRLLTPRAGTHSCPPHLLSRRDGR